MSAQILCFDAGFLGGNHERAFGRVALNLPSANFGQRGIITQRAAFEQRAQIRVNRCCYLFPLVQKLAIGFVTDSRHGDFFARQHDARDGHFIFCERAGFVGAYDRGAAERFDSSKFADDGAAFGHALHPDRKRDSDGNR